MDASELFFDLLSLGFVGVVGVVGGVVLGVFILTVTLRGPGL